MSRGLWHRTLIYLGLREQDEQGYDELPERFVPSDDNGHEPPRPTPEREDAEVRPLHLRDAHVRPVASAPVAPVAVVEVAAFDDVEAVAARFRSGQPVLFDLAEADRSDARRVVDFVSGLTYALDGSLTKVGTRAFLLVPDGLELADDERGRLSTLGYRPPAGSGA